MTTCKCFEELEIWQKAEILTLKVYQAMFHVKDYGFKDQIQRASVSIMNNIAEGFERETDDDFARFLSYSKGSCGEVRSMLQLAKGLSYIDPNYAEQLKLETIELSKQIKSLMKYLKQSNRR